MPSYADIIRRGEGLFVVLDFVLWGLTPRGRWVRDSEWSCLQFAQGMAAHRAEAAGYTATCVLPTGTRPEVTHDPR